jgi:hypothetical protein
MANHGASSFDRAMVFGVAACALAACNGTQVSGGAHAVSAAEPDGGPACTADDQAPPVLESHTLQLWPPNHKFHAVAVEDCVSAIDACEGELRGEFVWASSDEPIDSIGDGHHAPDIGIARDRRSACVRSERQGPKDGRVYKLGVRVVDAAGNAAEGECLVIVDHDQRGVTGSDSGEAYRVAFDAGTAACPGDDSESQAGAGGSQGQAGSGDEGEAGSGDEGEAGSGDEGEAGSGDEGEAGSGDEGEAGSGDEGQAGNGGEPIPQGPF